MKSISADNPFILPLTLLFLGLIGFILYQVELGQFNKFSFTFILYSLLLLIFVYYWALILENKIQIRVYPVNDIFSSILIFLKIFLLIKLILSAGVNTFDARLSVYGSSFLLGLDVTINAILFPYLTAFARNKFLRKLAFFIWFTSIVCTLILAPSKAILFSLLFNFLMYRFFLRKNSGVGKPLKIISLKFMLPLLFSLAATFALLYAKLGNSLWFVFFDRIAKNFDIAIYASQISDNSPPHNIFFYAILPILTKFDSSLYMLEFNKIPQWVLYEALGVEPRYGSPNDNLIVGLMLSFGIYSSFILFAFLIGFTFFIRWILCKRISLFLFFMAINIPAFFASTQDFMIKFFVLFPLFYGINFILFVLRKKIKHFPL